MMGEKGQGCSWVRHPRSDLVTRSKEAGCWWLEARLVPQDEGSPRAGDGSHSADCNFYSKTLI